MAAPKGTRPPGGSRKGIPNKATTELKAMILGALEQNGGQAWLAMKANECPGPFMTLLGKLLPHELQATIRREPRLMTDDELIAIASRGSGDPPAASADEPHSVH